MDQEKIEEYGRWRARAEYLGKEIDRLSVENIKIGKDIREFEHDLKQYVIERGEDLIYTFDNLPGYCILVKYHAHTSNATVQWMQIRQPKAITGEQIDERS